MLQLRSLAMVAAVVLACAGSAGAATLQKTFSLASPTLGVGLTGTNPYLATGSVEQFDSAAYGTLTQVGIEYEVQVEISNSIYNPGSSSQAYTVAIVITGSVTVDLPSGIQVFGQSLGHTTDDHTLNPNQGATVNTHYNWDSLPAEVYTGNLSGFQGTGNWAYTVNGVYSSVALSPNNTPVDITNSEITSYVNNGTVTYTYTPAPEASTYALIGVGLAVLLIFRRRRR